MFAIVGVNSKTKHGPLDEDRAITRAVVASVGTKALLPIMSGGKILGHAYDGMYSPIKYRCSFTNYADIQTAVGKGQWIRYNFNKLFNGATPAAAWYDLWPLLGQPEAGTYAGSAYTAVQYDNTSAGSFKLGGTVSAATKHLISHNVQNNGSIMTYMFYDRVLTYEACSFNANSSQAMTNTLTAQRYNGSGLSGMQIMMTGQTLLGSTASNLTTLVYKDQDGNSQNMPTDYTSAVLVSAAAPTTTIGARVISPAITTATPHSPFLPLVTQSTGVRSITSFITSAANSGTFTFALVRPIAIAVNPQANFPAQVDQVVNYTSLERIYDGACINVITWAQSGIVFALMGSFDVAWN